MLKCDLHQASTPQIFERTTLQQHIIVLSLATLSTSNIFADLTCEGVISVDWKCNNVHARNDFYQLALGDEIKGEGIITKFQLITEGCLLATISLNQ